MPPTHTSFNGSHARIHIPHSTWLNVLFAYFGIVSTRCKKRAGMLCAHTRTHASSFPTKSTTVKMNSNARAIRLRQRAEPVARHSGYCMCNCVWKNIYGISHLIARIKCFTRYTLSRRNSLLLFRNNDNNNAEHVCVRACARDAARWIEVCDRIYCRVRSLRFA